MAKKKVSDRNNKKKKKPLMPMDNIPKCSQQRRSSPPKRRTDFSLFFCCNLSHSSNSGSVLESSSVIKKSNSLGDSVAKHIFPSSLGQYSGKISDEGSGLSSNSSETSILEDGLDNQKVQLESHGDRKIDKLTSEDLGVSDYTPKKSHVSETLCVSPESVASDKTCEIWLPATNLSQALSGELVKNDDAASNNSDEQGLSSDKYTLSISSRVDDECAMKGRGKRERKPKVHFDDINISMLLKPSSEARRYRIMRHLGLTPPIGSPF